MKKEKFITRECKTHGLTEFVLEGRGFYRCKKCRTNSVVRRRKKLKSMAIDYLGGKCSKCGYDKSIWAMEFHHKENKDFGISAKGVTRSWDKVKAELNKCVLLCANCHRETHAEEYE